jgi:hypothetical protein
MVATMSCTFGYGSNMASRGLAAKEVRTLGSVRGGLGAVGDGV